MRTPLPPSHIHTSGRGKKRTVATLFPSGVFLQATNSPGGPRSSTPPLCLSKCLILCNRTPLLPLFFSQLRSPHSRSERLTKWRPSCPLRRAAGSGKSSAHSFFTLSEVSVFLLRARSLDTNQARSQSSARGGWAGRGRGTKQAGSINPRGGQRKEAWLQDTIGYMCCHSAWHGYCSR